MKTIDPNTVLASGDFAQPGVYRTGPNTYMAYVAAFTFALDPNLITVPVGAKVTFHIATRDVIHGFEIVNSDVNTMVVPGYVSMVTHTFKKKGTYLIVCNEYCGSGHHLMYATLKVV
jgi:cytochrome c oxidase subunit 2